MDKYELYKIAKETIHHIHLEHDGECGQVACALESASGNIYTGINIDLSCNLGFCAEQAAIAEMLKNKETKIKQLIAVYENGNILPPCGRCREFMIQIDKDNQKAKIIFPEFKDHTLDELLPYQWSDYE